MSSVQGFFFFNLKYSQKSRNSNSGSWLVISKCFSKGKEIINFKHFSVIQKRCVQI